MFKKVFKNSARLLAEGENYWVRSDGRYKHNKPSPYMFLWRRLLQSIISQSVTKMLTGKFHQGQCGIYKCEGGCKIHGVGELVLLNNCCSWGYDRNQSDKLRKAADLISYIVLESITPPTRGRVCSTKDGSIRVVDNTLI